MKKKLLVGLLAVFSLQADFEIDESEFPDVENFVYQKPQDVCNGYWHLIKAIGDQEIIKILESEAGDSMDNKYVNCLYLYAKNNLNYQPLVTDPDIGFQDWGVEVPSLTVGRKMYLLDNPEILSEENFRLLMNDFEGKAQGQDLGTDDGDWEFI